MERPRRVLMKRIKLLFASGLEIEFVDRDLGLRRVVEWAEKGVSDVKVVFGPEGCGKSAWLRQSAEVLRELGFDVIYVDPLMRDFIAYTDLRDFIKRFVDAASEILGVASLRLASLAIDFGSHALRAGRKKIAILVDEIFQAIGLDKAATYVKSLLNIIEYPPRSYDKMIAIVSTSEGVSRREIGRHRWAEPLPMWNMSEEGFRQLYNALPDKKLSFNETWRLTGGNPKLLAQLYETNWRVENIVDSIIERKRLRTFIASLTQDEKKLLSEALEDPDKLLERGREGVELLEKLVELNLVIDIPARKDFLWIDTPPPEQDPELGIGKHVAWQTPLHREALKKTLREHITYKFSSPP